MNQLKKRSFYYDNLKGFLIVLTVFAHILLPFQHIYLIDKIFDSIYFFHMPAFVFISGYFGKSKNSHHFEAIMKLIFLYFIFNNLIGFVYGFHSLLEPMYSYWYLLAMIVWRLTAHHIAKFNNIVLILLMISIFAGFYDTIDNTFAIGRVICFYPFYMSGYLLSKEKSDNFIQKAYSKRLILGVLYLIPAIVIACYASELFSYTDDALQMSAYQNTIDAFGRIFLFLIAFLIITALRYMTPDKKILFLTMFGRNSLWIFLLHRPVTLLMSNMIESTNLVFLIGISLIGTFLICLLFGNDKIAVYGQRFTDSGVAIFTQSKDQKFSFAKTACLIVALGFMTSGFVTAFEGITTENLKNKSDNSEDILYPVMTLEQQEEFDNAFRITFSGDLILLEDQVKRAYTEKGYDFSPVFEYAQKYIASADYAIGVFEGPMAGKEAGFSSSNFNDEKELHLNFPDEFAQAVQNAGFDLVTTANNHLLDKGIDGALRTLDILDEIGLDHIGTYRNFTEKQENRIKFVEKDGIKIAILAYTYGSNGYDTQTLANGELSYLTSVISGTSRSKLFKQLKSSIEQDFLEAKTLNPDLIVVLPHIGTQFSNFPDEEQESWFNLFKECGADIILGDHPHVVEPIKIEEYQGRSIYTAYCPGNFSNIYRDEQGDTSMLIDVFINRTTKTIIGGGVVPLYTQSAIDGNYRALPIYDILHDEELRCQLSTDDYALANQANRTVTQVVFGHEMDISSVTERYYFNQSGFLRKKANGLLLSADMRNGIFWNALQQAETVCFIGDSVTEGTKNGGCPWYEPVEAFLHRKTILNFSKGGCTVSYMLNRIAEIPEADLYVIALGTNDVRYRDASQCAMTTEEYLERMNQLCQELSKKRASAKFLLIAPWYSTDGDPFCPLSYQEKIELNEAYSEALEIFCNEKNYLFINANPYLQDAFYKAPERNYLLDHIHPNAGAGVLLYTEAILLY